jgi:two-component system, sporulation sensor kinase C
VLMNPQGDATRVAPNDGAAVVSPQLRAHVARLLAPFAQQPSGASALMDQPITLEGLTDSRWGIAVVQPVLSREDGVAAVVALLDERGLVAPFVGDTGAGFTARAFVADSEIVGMPRSGGEPALTSVMHIGSRAITLTFTPQSSVTSSPLPDLVLVLGLAIAALVALTLWLARKTYEQASAVGMTRMQRAIERATDGVWELDVIADRAHRSEALLRYLGLDPATINGPAAAWIARVHPEDRAAVQGALQAHLAGRADAFECEYRVRAGDGDWHTIVDRGRVVERALDGRPQRLLGISADTTERARANAAREESERRFRAMFDTAYQLQLLLDLDGSVLEANRAAAELAGTTVEDVQGQIFSSLPWWPDDELTRSRVQERVARARAGDSSRFEVELIGANDRRAFVDFSLKPIVDHEQQVVQVLAEGRDLTERKRAEASLREIGALTTMGQLAARVAHEINNPLAGIQNAFLLVRGAIPVDHPHFRFVGAIEREIARIAAVTRQLYETYRPDQAMGSSSSVILAISDAVIFLDQVNRARQVRIVTDVARAPSLVPVPDALLRQTLYNLVQNALDATPSGGTITVTALLDASSCVIRVTDEGPGVPDALRDRIFDPFFSTKDRSVKTGGMGIGLSLVRQSVLAVGGEIVVQNLVDRGTMFEVRFPMTPIDTGVLR